MPRPMLAPRFETTPRPARLALVRDDVDAAPVPLTARRWRRLVGRRRGPSVSVALVYLGGVCCVAALGAHIAHLLPAAGPGEP